MRVKFELRRWSGHGEGGSTAHVVYDERIGNVYMATEHDIRAAMARVDELNKILEDAGL
jgi:hypothetical protein